MSTRTAAARAAIPALMQLQSRIPDGYTLLLARPAQLVVPTGQALHQEHCISSEPRISRQSRILGLHADRVVVRNQGLPAGKIRARSRSPKPDLYTVNFGSASMGSTRTSRASCSEHDQDRMGGEPYRGTGPAMNDLIGGPIQMFFDLLPEASTDQHRQGTRDPPIPGRDVPAALPDLPTVAEQGLAEFNSLSWVAAAAPAKTPAPVLAKLRAEVTKGWRFSRHRRAHSRARLRAGRRHRGGRTRLHGRRGEEVGRGHPHTPAPGEISVMQAVGTRASGDPWRSGSCCSRSGGKSRGLMAQRAVLLDGSPLARGRQSRAPWNGRPHGVRTPGAGDDLAPASTSSRMRAASACGEPGSSLPRPARRGSP